jgi:amino acid adenylation domain-containing protein
MAGGTLMGSDRKIQNIFKLSPMQKNMLFSALLDQDSSNYFEQSAFAVEGRIDIAILARSFQELVNRYDILRTNFISKQVNEPLQIVFEERTASLVFEDISLLDEASREAFIREFRENDRKNHFNLAKDILMRLVVLRTGERDYRIIWSFHHIIMDGWCVGILMKEFFQIYGRLKNHAPLDLDKAQPYSEFIKWLEKQNQEKAAAFWKDYLAGYETGVFPPGYRPDSSPGPYARQEYDFELDAATTQRLVNLAKVNHITFNTVFQTLWGLLLQRCNRTNDVVFGSVVSGRPAAIAGIENMVGLFINTIPVRVKAEDSIGILELMRKLQQTSLETGRYQYVSLADLQADTAVKQGLINHILAFENFPLDETLRDSETGPDEEFSIAEVDTFEQTGYDLNVLLGIGDQLSVKLIYNANAFDEGAIGRIEHFLKRMIRLITENPHRLAGEIDLVTDAERNLILNDFNRTRADYPKDKTLPELFEAAAQSHPSHPALFCNDRQFTYQELNQKANQLAWRLRSKGVGPESIVAIMTGRSPEMIVGILGILKAGGAFLPIDPDYPESRIRYMLKDCGVKLLLTKGRQPVGWDDVETIALEEAALYCGDGNNPEPVTRAENLAYVIYTSGSTGKPKGTLTTHRNVMGVVKNSNYIEITSEDKLLQLSNYAFDGSIFDIWGALVNGAGLVLVEPETLLDIKNLGEAITKHGVTVMFMTTALFNTLVDVAPGCLKPLRKVLFGGERVSAAHVRKAYAQLGPGKLIHVYGPTETTVFATFYPVDSLDDHETTVPIGKPLSNTRLYVLGPENRLQPVKIAGELCISGDGLARGYLNRPELTAEKFVANPFAPGERMYRTGDLAQWLPDGTIEFLGRIDHQVKLRGFRIELGEIEARLLKEPAIQTATVIDRADATGNKYLCAYVVATEPITVTELKKSLARDLPGYMCPSCFVQLEKMPLTSNGKIDRKALPDPEGNLGTGGEYAAPANRTEAKLVALWREVLGGGPIGVRDNFFELGGHSLKATTVVSRIAKELDVEVPLRAIFQYPTIRELAQYMRRAACSRFAAIEPVDRQVYYPVSSAQKRLYIIHQMQGWEIGYNMPGVLTLEGELNRARLEAAFKGLIERHETLRTSFAMADGEPVQRVWEQAEFAVQYREANEDEIEAIIQGFIRPFDLSRAPLLRVGLLKLHPTRHILLLDMHHIIGDGVSMAIMVRELVHLYRGATLPELRIQYKDFSAWQNKLMKSEVIAKQERYWLNTFSGAIPVLDLPADYARPALQSFEGASFEFEVDPEFAARLKQLAQETGSTLYMVLLAAYAVLLAKYTGQEEIIIGSPIAGRSHADLETIIGMFVNTLAMYITPRSGATFLEFLKEVRENALAAYENQDCQFEELVDKLDVRRDFGRNPLFDVMFVLENMEVEPVEIEGLKISPFPVVNRIAKFDITLRATEGETGIDFSLDYCTKLFKAATIERMAGHFLRILTAITENRTIKLAEIELLSEAEKHLLIQGFNSVKAQYPNQTFGELFEAQARKTPSKTAVVCGLQRLTYQDLERRANQLAGALSKKGVTTGSVVGLTLEPGCPMIIGILGVLKTGAAYLPIDPLCPIERFRFMMKDSGAKLILTQSNPDDLEMEWETLRIDEFNDLNEEPFQAISTHTPRNLVYVIYTSGTSGQPKGVQVENGSLVNYVTWFTRKAGLTSQDKTVLVSSYAFDLGYTGLFPALASGCELHLLPKEEYLEPERLLDYIQTHQITYIKATPSLFTMITHTVSHLKSGAGLPLRLVVLGGEPIHPDDIEAFRRKNPHTGFMNHYGPTETTIGCVAHAIDFNRFASFKEQPVIGSPIQNTQVYILDRNLKLAPLGVPGEIHIGGAGLARGYLNLPELNAAKFVDNPWVSGERMYRTGDRARWLPDGTIQFLGRIDSQVKIRGYRIEVGEIEKRLLEYEPIREVVVSAKEDDSGAKYLCAYLVAKRTLSVAEIRKYLRKALPDYMCPSCLVQLEKMPVTSNGKIDRRALPKPEGNIQTGVEYVAPQNEIDAKLAQIWQKLLGVERVGVLDNFFDLGGNSLKIFSLMMKVNQVFGVAYPMRELFNAPTIRAMSENILKIHVEHGEDSMMLLNEACEKKIFAFPPASAYGLAYLRMAKLFETHGFYGFNFIEAESRIGDYVELITKVQPEGDYVLFGYSAGGNLAFEVAKELKKRGFKVADLILLDSVRRFEPQADREADPAAEIGELIDHMHRLIGFHGDDQMIAEKIKRYSIYLNQLVNSGWIDANIHLIWSVSEAGEEADQLARFKERWGEVTWGEFRQYQGFGPHHQMLDEDFERLNAAVIQNILAGIADKTGGNGDAAKIEKGGKRYLVGRTLKNE